MISGYDPIVQSFLGTLFTWGLTALGAALVFVFSSSQRTVLDGSLGFAAGVMLAASYWSLLAPAIEMAEDSGGYGDLVFVPVSIGFVAGALFVAGADSLLPYLGLHSSNWAVEVHKLSAKEEGLQSLNQDKDENDFMSAGNRTSHLRNRTRGSNDSLSSGSGSVAVNQAERIKSWKRIILLIIAITVHNIPEGLAVGVGFGAIGKSPSATFESARSLAIGIGIQNFPEGLAVSLPLRAAGVSLWKSFWWGQLSGMVEPAAGLFGAVAVVLAEPLLPYALAFAAGAMVYVVVDDIVPEAHSCGNGKLSSLGVIIGFIIMMSLDVGLG